MMVKGSSVPSSRPGGPRYCQHDAAREIRIYMPYTEANAVRLRFIRARDPRWRHVSAIYEIPHGWAWTLCNDCPAEARPERVGR